MKKKNAGNSKSQLQEVLELANLRVYPSYGGRHDSVGTCVTITVENLGEMFASVLEVIEEEDTSDLQESFRSMQIEPMGSDSILVYFPDTDFFHDEDSPDEDEETDEVFEEDPSV